MVIVQRYCLPICQQMLQGPFYLQLSFGFQLDILSSFCWLFLEDKDCRLWFHLVELTVNWCIVCSADIRLFESLAIRLWANIFLKCQWGQWQCSCFGCFNGRSDVCIRMYLLIVLFYLICVSLQYKFNCIWHFPSSHSSEWHSWLPYTSEPQWWRWAVILEWLAQPILCVL